MTINDWDDYEGAGMTRDDQRMTGDDWDDQG